MDTESRSAWPDLVRFVYFCSEFSEEDLCSGGRGFVLAFSLRDVDRTWSVEVCKFPERTRNRSGKVFLFFSSPKQVLLIEIKEVSDG